MMLKQLIRLIPVLTLGFALVLSCGDDGPTESGDTTPPARVTSLSIGSVTDSSVLLTWIAPGDDSISGNASAYDIRYSLAFA